MATTAEATTEFNVLLKASESGPVVVMQSGKPVAVIVGVADEDDVERLLMAHSPQLQSILEIGRASCRERV